MSFFKAESGEKEQTGSVPVFNTNLNRLKKLRQVSQVTRQKMERNIPMKTRLKYLGIILLTITVFILITSNVYAEPDSIALPKLGLR